MDCFAILGIPRQVWIDPEYLKERFLARSAELHPDKAGTPQTRAEAERAFTLLNQAHQVLRGTRSRILHLLELEGGTGAGQPQDVPAEVMDFFGPVGALAKKAGAILREKNAAHSPMLKARLFEQGLECTDELQALQAKIRERIQVVEESLRTRPAAVPLNSEERARLQHAATVLGYLERWHGQLQEQTTALTF